MLHIVNISYYLPCTYEGQTGCRFSFIAQRASSCRRLVFQWYVLVRGVVGTVILRICTCTDVCMYCMYIHTYIHTYIQANTVKSGSIPYSIVFLLALPFGI